MSSSASVFIRAALASALLLSAWPLLAKETPEAPALSAELVGRDGESLLTVPRWGRYAVLVNSQQGAAVQIVDKMNGPGAQAGQEGHDDGRLDLLLERGTYKLRLGVAEGDQAQLAVRAFEELSGEIAPRLVEDRLVRGELGDFQQRSFWIEVPSADAPVMIEAAGRNLADIRLWRDGSWLEPARPSCEVIQPEPGRPLRDCQIVAQLEPGLYLLSAYGGPELAWTEGPSAHPFVLRSGLTELPEAGRSVYTISPFGVDRYVIPEKTRYARLELPQAERATLSVRALDPARPYRVDGQSAAITTESRVPVAEVTAAGNEMKVVTVSGRAGQRYTLQHFAPASRVEPIRATGKVWIASLHSGFPQDNLDATAVLVRTTAGRSQIVADDALTFDGDTAWKRKFNLTGKATLYVEVTEAGSYAIRSTGTPAQFAINPLFASTPPGFKPMVPVQATELRWELDPGFYVLTMQPVTPGIGEVEIRAAGALDRVIDAVGLGDESVEAPRAGVVFPGFQLEEGGAYSLYLGEQPEVQLGVIARPFPLDLSNPLPLALRAGESVRVAARVSEPGTVVAVTDAGRPMRVSVDDGTPVPGARIKAGDHWVRVTNESKQSVLAGLWLRTDAKDPEAPLPALTPELLASLPDFPVLDASGPRFADLGVTESTTWKVDVTEAGLYALRSTGLLSTHGTVRTRMVPSFRADAESGPGRNFELMEYLGEGDYQLTVRTQGRTQGHFGVELARTTLHDGGELTDGVPARAEVGAGEGVAYTFSIAETGRYSVRSFGVGRSFRCRLEDGEGWPILTPGSIAELDLRLKAGDYRLIILPEPEAGRRLTLIQNIPEPTLFDGHGPHPLVLDREQGHIWREPIAGQERASDVWTFEMPASADVTLRLSGDMVGELLAPDGSRFARTAPGEAWQGRLFAGSWRLEVKNGRRDNGVRYTVQLTPTQLVPGLEREVLVPGQLGLSVGVEGLYELGSIGGTDVRARLYDARGALLADVDDRPQDWNFRVVQRLEPGDYTLRLDPVAVSSGRTRVSLRARVEKQQAALRLPAVLSVVPGESVQLIPLTLPDNVEILAMSLRSSESMGASLEAKIGERWVTVATGEGVEARLEARLGGEARGWRLRLWSLDIRGNPVELRVDALRASRLSEAALGRGVSAGSASKSLSIAAVSAKLDRPGVFVPQGAGERLRWCPRAGAGCIEAPATGIAEPGQSLWLVARGGEDKRLSIGAKRAVLGAGEQRVVLDGQTAVALDPDGDGEGPVVALVRSAAGQPGVSVQPWEQAMQPAADGTRMAIGDASALSVGLGIKKPALVLWSADGKPNEVVVQQRRFEPVSTTIVSIGAFEDRVAPGQGRAYALPQAGMLRLVLDEGLVAVLSDERGARSVHWAERGALQERIVGARGTLTVLNPGFGATAQAGFRAELVPDERRVSEIALGASVEELAWEGGRLRLPVAAADPESGTVVHLRGRVRQAALIGPDGVVARGVDLPVGAGGGTLIVDLEPGLFLAWMDRPGEEGKALWATAEPGSARTVALPINVPVTGPSQRLRLSPTSAGLLRIRSAAPLVVAVRRTGSAPEVHALQAGGALDVWLPAASTDLDVRGLAGAPLWGQLELAFSEAAPLGEGLGEEVMLAAGDTRLYRFSVQREGAVGFGVRASGDQVQATLFDASGARLATGLVAMISLKPGEYLLAVHVPPGEAPIRMQPALAGVLPPPSGPPPEVVRDFMNLAGLTPVEE